MDLARTRGIELPERCEELRYLTPFAVEFRYDVFPEEPEAPLDKVQVRQSLKDFRSWVGAFLQRHLT
jgi:hypothetical protein